MPITRKKIQDKVEEARARAASGNINFFKSGQTKRLRILSFKDEDGDTIFDRPMVEWNSKGTGKFRSIIDRGTMFDEPDAVEKLVAMAAVNGEEAPYRRRTRYLVNAIDMDVKPFEVKIWALPSSVWEVIAEMVLTDDWEHVLDLKDGHGFRVKRTGEGLNTEYKVQVSPKSWSVAKALAKEIIDPLDVVDDPGLEGQCRALGVDLEDLGFGDDMEEVSTKKKKKGKGKKKPVEEDDDEDEDDEDWEDEDEESDDDDEDEDDEEEEDNEDDEEEEEEPEPPKKKGKKKRVKKSEKRQKVEDEADSVVSSILKKKKGEKR